ncbi:acetate/propionate family kinase [Furfurilactobacillus rossiae]|uniref:Acetate kinase n=1 Tax=Furfurilactobacillus rossiae DSM 15814 TaxID=1114972 RepID=A0A0R1RBR6_9LACO|nr:acetate kinase [Furfurilactobacillus rossiae]KRL54129.1 acetate kinase [Furfurilactobacillus rossiae DSM 15814]MCF6166559.1 acetate kinase [Furfurilactobacillus rossiae]QFR66288.1 acetate/propionate family kinase [Furfurilactobacillus rossiae]QLE61735.1 Acetate kinase [Furfurilactobacillus rossiae]QLE64535.1 Acetate kinase [Furfurilactobacillus rossiae]
MAKTIAVNAGSSTLKFQLFDMPSEEVIAKGLVDRIGLAEGSFTIDYGDGQHFKIEQPFKDHKVAINVLLKELIDLKVIGSFDEITGVGHRVVAGGEFFKDSVVIDDDVLAKIDELAEYAPLHNPANATGIRAFREVLPNATAVAVFDTSFHSTMPEENYLYSIPYEYYEKFGARRYGAHGTSHRYVSARAAEILGKPLSDLKVITLHLGAGASIDAIKNGESIDTSMGFTPLAGITMATRSGDVDPSLVTFLQQKLGITNPEAMIDILNKKSGLLGISGTSGDMRDLQTSDDHRAQLAIKIFVNRIVKYVGSYIAEMGGVDALVFTAGIGENAKAIRAAVVNAFNYAGIKIDDDRNDVHGKEAIISTDDSTAKVLLIPTDEELMIARDVERLKK